MPLLLHIETSTKICSVALSNEGKLLAHHSYEGEGFVHSEKLTVFIGEIMQKAKVKADDLSAVSVAGGPGSYTGLRIGVSTAKGLCYALNIPLIAIDSLHALAAWAKQNEPQYTGLLCPMIDARRMEVFAAIYANDLAVLKPISADILEENSYSEYTSKNTMLVVGDGAEKCKSLWATREAIQFKAYCSDARGQIDLAFSAYQTKNFEDVAYYEPFYLKDFILGEKK